MSPRESLACRSDDNRQHEPLPYSRVNLTGGSNNARVLSLCIDLGRR